MFVMSPASMVFKLQWIAKNALFLCLVFLIGVKSTIDGEVGSVDQVRARTEELFKEGNIRELLSYLDAVENTYNGLNIDALSPSLYSYRGVALYNSQAIAEARVAFTQAVRFHPGDTRSWINLGEVEQQTFNNDASISAFGEAYRLGDALALPYLVRAKGWTNSWQDFELLTGLIEKNVRQCMASSPVYDADICRTVDSSSGYEYTYLPGKLQRLGYTRTPNARSSEFTIASSDIAQYWPRSQDENQNNQQDGGAGGENVEVDFELSLPPTSALTSQIHRRLKVGIVSSDFGVHPVATLARGLLQYIDKAKIELFAFSLQPRMSWWGRNISQSVEHFISVDQVNTKEAASLVAAYGIEILIDLNGHTQFSGLRLMAHKPAPVQMSFLGLPTTTGASFIDYYLGDSVALPAEYASHFTESLVLVPECYIVNDYAQLQGDMIDFISPVNASEVSHTVPRNIFTADRDISSSKAPFLMATFSNTQKIEPSIFNVWTNILQRFPQAKMVHVDHKGSANAISHMRRSLNYFGLHASRFALLSQAPWIDHLMQKSAVDLVLDTSVKNGHTTGLDGIFAGVPTVTFATGTTMSSRAGQSILTSLGSELGLAYSNKDYENSVYRIASLANRFLSTKTEAEDSSLNDDLPASFPNSTRLSAWRYDIRKKRSTSSLYDTKKWTKQFERHMQAVWELAHLRSRAGRPFHIFGTRNKNGNNDEDFKAEDNDGTIKERILETNQIYTDESEFYNSKIGKSRRGDNAYMMTNTLDEDIPSSKHVNFTPPTPKGRDRGFTQTENEEAWNRASLPAGIFDGRYIFLNIGGYTAKTGWYNVNSQSKDLNINSKTLKMNVDINRMMDNLYGFPDKSVSAIYASHILEHASFGDNYLFKTLREWHRVLRPNGLLMISVPDLETVFQLYLRPNITLEERWLLTRVIFGAQTDIYDYHKVGFSEDILTHFLGNIFDKIEPSSGSKIQSFCDIERVDSFQLFPDSSELVISGRRISLNIAAKKCPQPSDTEAEKAFHIAMNSIPYTPQEFPHQELCSRCGNDENDSNDDDEGDDDDDDDEDEDDV